MDERPARQRQRLPPACLHRRAGTRDGVAADARDQGAKEGSEAADPAAELIRPAPLATARLGAPIRAQPRSFRPEKTIARRYGVARPDRGPRAKPAPRALPNGVRVRNLQKISKETPGLLQAVLSGRGYISCHALSRRGLDRPRRQQF